MYMISVSRAIIMVIIFLDTLYIFMVLLWRLNRSLFSFCIFWERVVTHMYEYRLGYNNFPQSLHKRSVYLEQEPLAVTRYRNCPEYVEKCCRACSCSPRTRALVKSPKNPVSFRVKTRDPIDARGHALSVRIGGSFSSTELFEMTPHIWRMFLSPRRVGFLFPAKPGARLLYTGTGRRSPARRHR